MNDSSSVFRTRLVLLTMVMWSASCVISPGRAQRVESDSLDHRILQYTYLEEGQLVTLAVNTEAARRREQSPFIPIGLGVANNGSPRLTIHRENVTLVDDQGHRYPMATVREVKSLGSKPVLDLRVSDRFASVFGQRMLSRPRVASVFFPIRVTEPGLQGRGIVADSIQLPRHHWMIDVIYFPHPEGELRGRRYELWLAPPELSDPVFVRFAID